MLGRFLRSKLRLPWSRTGRSEGTAGVLRAGRTYRVITPFADYDGRVHPIGETWKFLKQDYLPYEDGLTALVKLDGQYVSFRLQWREDTQGPILDDLDRYVREVG